MLWMVRFGSSDPDHQNSVSFSGWDEWEEACGVNRVIPNRICSDPPWRFCGSNRDQSLQQPNRTGGTAMLGGSVQGDAEPGRAGPPGRTEPTQIRSGNKTSEQNQKELTQNKIRTGSGFCWSQNTWFQRFWFRYQNLFAVIPFYKTNFL